MQHRLRIEPEKSAVTAVHMQSLHQTGPMLNSLGAKASSAFVTVAASFAVGLCTPAELHDQTEFKSCNQGPYFSASFSSCFARVHFPRKQACCLTVSPEPTGCPSDDSGQALLLFTMNDPNAFVSFNGRPPSLITVTSSLVFWLLLLSLCGNSAAICELRLSGRSRCLLPNVKATPPDLDFKKGIEGTELSCRTPLQQQPPSVMLWAESAYKLVCRPGCAC